MKPSSPALFLLRFSCLAAALVGLGWRWVEPYCSTLAAPVNWLLERDGLPVFIHVSGTHLTLLQHGAPAKAVRVALAGQDALFVALLGALALCAAVTRVRLLTRVLTVCGLVAAMWVVHAVGLYAVVYGALGDLIGSLPPPDRQAALAGAWHDFDMDRAHLCSRLAAVWLTAAPPALGLVAWLHLAPLPFTTGSKRPAAPSHETRR